MDEFFSALMNETIRHAMDCEMVPSDYFLTWTRVHEWKFTREKPHFLVTSISRVTDQKIYLLRQPGLKHPSALEDILDILGPDNLYVFIGTGTKEHEEFLTRTSAKWPNFIFLRAFASDECVNAVYGNGDLFLMPSSFEPCGISQMLAMREGQPCLVHGVGGLRDTVINKKNGFVFSGNSLKDQIENMVGTFENAMRMYENEPDGYEKIRENAAGVKFLWDDSVQQYIDILYKF